MSETTRTLTDALTPSFLKTVLTMTFLKEVMTDAMVFRHWISDINGISMSGLYICGEGTKNTPKGLTYGMLLHFSAGTQDYGNVDIFLPSDISAGMFVRIWWGGKWSAWQVLAVTAA